VDFFVFEFVVVSESSIFPSVNFSLSSFAVLVFLIDFFFFGEGDVAWGSSVTLESPVSFIKVLPFRLRFRSSEEVPGVMTATESSTYVVVTAVSPSVVTSLALGKNDDDSWELSSEVVLLALAVDRVRRPVVRMVVSILGGSVGFGVVVQ